MPTIHPTAIIEGDVDLADDVIIGPYCIIKGPVTLGPGVRLYEHVSLQGPVTIGADTLVYPRAAIGFEPQDYKFTPGMPTAGVVIGEKCLIREHSTIHAATSEQAPTKLASNVFMMVNSHVGHDATVANHVILGNNACLAGHSHVQERAIVSAACLIHQFCRVGKLTMLSGGCRITTDLPPFCMIVERNLVVSLNLVGLRRGGYTKDDINTMRDVFSKILRPNLPRQETIARLEARSEDCQPVRELAQFYREAKRPVATVTRKREQLS